jgi:hypothetical protein
MDAETWINGTAAVDEGWADDLLGSDQIQEAKNSRAAVRASPYLIDVAMAKAGMPRSERRSLLQEFKADTLRAAGSTGKPSAADNGTPGAAEAVAFLDSIRQLSAEIQL